MTPRRRRDLAVTFALAVALAGCAPRAKQPSQQASQPRPFTPIYLAQQDVAQYIDSGRYDAELARVTDAAIAWLDERAPKTKRPAIVLDVDETSLSNWRAYRVNGWARILHGPCDLKEAPCGLRAWQEMAIAPALQPTLRLVERARALGIAVFFISGRPQELRAATERNLRDQGFTFTEVVLRPEDRRFMSAVEFKAPVRQRIAADGYTILLSIGDQQSDLDGGNAERTFKLPNPVYFLP